MYINADINTKIYEELARIVREKADSLAFNILEIGALPVSDRPEKFHGLLRLFPGSRINAFEVDPDVCTRLNSNAVNGMTYHPIALGRREEERPFYMTKYPMCASLYRPNERFIARYNNMEFSILKNVGSIKTVSMDYFVAQNNIGPVDFIKIDIQGAELDVFQGGPATLKDVVSIITEVEFVHMYENQPLFGDVNEFLVKSGFTFHKFFSLLGRSLKPTLINSNPNFTTQHMWADAMYVRDLMKLEKLSPNQLLKLAVLASMYGSPDISIHCIQEYDSRLGTDINRQLAASVASINTPRAGRNEPCPCGSGKKLKNCHGSLSNSS
jgi:FkbM family methyltransferase